MTITKFFYFLSLFSVITFFSLFTNAQISADQDNNEESETYTRIKPLHSINLDVGLPVALKNSSFKQYMQGMIYLCPRYHFTFKNFLTLGGGLNYNYFWINHVVTSDSKNLGGIQSIGGYVSIGYEKFYTDRFGIDVNLKIGQSKLIFDTDYNRKLSKLPALNVLSIQPSVAFVVTADDHSSYKWVLSYTNENYNFNSTYLGFPSGTLNSSDNSSFTKYLSVGFGYTYYIKQR